VLSRRTVAVRGTADNPMNRDEIETKALDLIGDVMGARRARAIVRAVRALTDVTDVTVLGRLWRPLERAERK
jgi:hypothetical protein